jgi:hypothetical protein
MEICKLSDEGENILKLIKQTRQFFEQVSLLLRHADENMTKEGWNPESNYALSEMSYNIMNPSQWLPIMISRFYKNKDHPNLLAYVSVLLDDHWERKYTITEPLVTAGLFNYVSPVADNWDYFYARYFGYLSKSNNLKADGKPFYFDNQTLSPGIQGKFQRGSLFAVPLTSIKGPTDVELVTKKLLELLKEQN